MYAVALGGVMPERGELSLVAIAAAASANAPTIIPWPAYPLSQVRVSSYQIPYIVVFSSRQRQSLRFILPTQNFSRFDCVRNLASSSQCSLSAGCEDS
jgi:hypothetical protein